MGLSDHHALRSIYRRDITIRPIGECPAGKRPANDPSTQNGPVNELAILGLLKEQPLHGYELKKRLTGVLGARATLSFGSLYPALGRLERSGSVTAVDVTPGTAPVPMTGSLGGEVAAYRARAARPARSRRNRKVYAITASGEARLRELLRAPAHDDREFLLQVAFCRQLLPAERLELFHRRRDELQARLQARPVGGRDHYLRSVRERDSQSIAHDIAWLDRLIAEEDDSDASAGDETTATDRNGHTEPRADDAQPDDTTATPAHDPALPGGSR
jgi:DNA-binding PadR family transcriptional regulator